ncbi:histidine phosphatase family protein [Nitratireductor aquimarinus]|nr:MULTISPECIES: histidine phosphatase family protein [Nitratireductor]MBN7776533.1 histidine phosphatase family protein [Nitratireductor pacificus]MBN7779400.1 histidine phosphatase family protein [Nitratireductor pacificus]MBN7788207.1 histidine phosphatase family protein [Nitratireductor aquimarinus]MBY6098254.1 histidine phosphatase family protein [Nitratireductor aquimarinus]MCA1259233.1 histidine phosphatase family protein [Nitratireductor aquimarinus]
MFVRHGETQWNASRRLRGHVDSSITSNLKWTFETAKLLGMEGRFRHHAA